MASSFAIQLGIGPSDGDVYRQAMQLMRETGLDATWWSVEVLTLFAGIGRPDAHVSVIVSDSLTDRSDVDRALRGRGNSTIGVRIATNSETTAGADPALPASSLDGLRADAVGVVLCGAHTLEAMATLPPHMTVVLVEGVNPAELSAALDDVHRRGRLVAVTFPCPRGPHGIDFEALPGLVTRFVAAGVDEVIVDMSHWSSVDRRALLRDVRSVASHLTDRHR